MSKNKSATRRGERSLAFQVLYGLSFSPAGNIGELRRAFWQSPDNADKADKDQSQEEHSTAPQGFAWELVEGVWSNATELDAVITRFSHNWRVDRMGRIELTILRIGLFEMLYRADIPSKVAINEALELSRQFGEESARSFVNGILDATSKALESGQVESRIHQPQ